MPPTAFAFLLASALLHTTWNFLLRATEDRLAFAWWTLVAIAPLALPVVLAYPALRGAWPFALTSAALEAGYFSTLTIAYGRGDFSLVYPIARGTAPLLLATGAVVVLGERPGLMGLAGLAILAVGLLVISGGLGMIQRRDRRPPPSGVGWALAVALFISLYSLVDGAAMRHFPPAPYTILVFGLSALLTTPLLLVFRGGRKLAAEGRRSWRRVLIVSACSFLSYTLVLQAYRIAPVAYAGAVREVSVVLAALAGWLLLGEGFGPSRTVGALLAFLGLLLIALAG